MTGSEVEWGYLTLADMPTTTSDSFDDISNTALASDEGQVTADDLLYDGTLPTSTDAMPAETESSSGGKLETGAWAMIASICAAMATRAIM